MGGKGAFAHGGRIVSRWNAVKAALAYNNDDVGVGLQRGPSGATLVYSLKWTTEYYYHS